MSFTWGFIFGLMFGFGLLLWIVSAPVLLEHLRSELDRKLTEAEEDRNSDKLRQ
jgi:hypothetical protein